VFDFWFEYKSTIPKGYTRLLGKLAELTDSGIAIHFFLGNHDMWMNGYFEKELNIPVYAEPKVFERFGKKLFIGHGDGLNLAIMAINLLKKFLEIPFANGCLEHYIQLGVLDLPITLVEKVEQKLVVAMPNF
jgi:UDP-2,3-diacylglucosamine hydrolase